MKKFAIAIGIVAVGLAVVTAAALGGLAYVRHSNQSRLDAINARRVATWPQQAKHMPPMVAFSGMIPHGDHETMMVFMGVTARSWPMCKMGEMSAAKIEGADKPVKKGCWTGLKDKAHDTITVRWEDGSEQHWPLHEIPNVIANDDYAG